MDRPRGSVGGARRDRAGVRREAAGSRLLVTGAGTGPSTSLIRSLRTGDPSFFIVGCHADRFALKQSGADRNYLIPSLTHPGFADALRRVIEAERIDLLIPNSDADVWMVSRLRDQVSCRVFLPRPAVIEVCQDKCALAAFLRDRGLPAPLTYPVTALPEVEEIFRRLAPRSRLWCRMRTGQASLGAILVKTPEQARSWIGYWAEMRGVPATAFSVSEYLPGRDFACQSLWREGKRVLVKTFERVAYLAAGNHPSGVSSLAALSKTVFEPRVAEVCAAAIRALDPEASGVFCADLKEDADGVPCVTEINAGRFSMSTSLYDLAGKHNMAVTYVGLALGEPVEIREEYDVAEDYYLVRDFDTLPGVFHAEEFFQGIEEAWA